MANLKVLLLIWLLLVPTLWAQQSKNSLTQTELVEIIRRIDALYRSQSSYSEIEMEIVTPNWQRTLSMKAWTEGMKKTLLRITSPKKEMGVATLRIQNEMWNYLPKTNKVMKVPPSMMMSSWMGSDFTNDDLVKEFSLFEDYSYELIEIPDSDTSLMFINSIPREDLPVVWGNVVIAVRKSDHIPVWQKYYDEKGNLMRVLTYSNVRKFGDRIIPSTMEMVPMTKEGNKTVIRYLTVEFDAEIPEEMFTLRSLRTEE
ncbi:MAG: outer membrane lipoprotein-sorting protein [candidate division Zixibacteria bacterium]|nr:outer membrane lipoprotein-sorting protein [candidate division Zixibacteria bacterium]MBU1470289.1 outer membrane lipoprotein-sorting protein [candidate division Zixibacteria bacterium]MBU2624802.1 outer membrane lipoprotein-sorting protein [candidate division Zixibacteria bacterium]